MTDDTGSRPNPYAYLNRDALPRRTFEDAEHHFRTWENKTGDKRRYDLEKWAFVALAIGLNPDNPPQWALDACVQFFHDEHFGVNSIVCGQRRSPKSKVEIEKDGELVEILPDYNKLMEKLADEIVSEDIERYQNYFYSDEIDESENIRLIDILDKDHPNQGIVLGAPQALNSDAVADESVTSANETSDQSNSILEEEQFGSLQSTRSSSSLNALCKRTIREFFQIEQPLEDDGVKKSLSERWSDQTDEERDNRLLAAVRRYEDLHGFGKRFSLARIERKLSE